MALDSWITPEETPTLAEQAMAVIDARLARLSDAQRLAYWASIRKAYNTPYNPVVKPTPVAILAAHEPAMPPASIAAAVLAPEAQAA